MCVCVCVFTRVNRHSLTQKKVALGFDFPTLDHVRHRHTSLSVLGFRWSLRMKKQRHHFVNKDPCSQGYGFSSGHVLM